METEIRNRPSFAMLDVTLAPDESITAEAGAMVSKSADVEVSTNAGGGGILGSLKRSVTGGESFFVNRFTAPDGGRVTLAPPLPGDVVEHDLADETLLVQSGSYLASAPGIETDTRFGGGRSFFGGEGLFLLELQGTGSTFLNSYGAIETVDLADGERYVVDTGHIVAFEETTNFAVERVGGLRSTLFSGEGLVCNFTGPGRVWLQTRSQDAFLSWLIPKLPTDNTA